MNQLRIAVTVFLTGLVIVSGCATSNYNYYQDGKPSGKNEGIIMLGVSVGGRVDYEVNDEVGEKPVIEIGSDKKFSPLVSILAHGGATDHIDIGMGLSMGFWSLHLRLSSIFCLVDKNHKFGIGLLPAVNLAFTPDTLFGDVELSTSSWNVNCYFSVPVSYDIHDRITMFIRPTYGFEWSGLKVKDNDEPYDQYEETYNFNGEGISVGMNIEVKKPKGFISPEVSFISFDEGIHYVPFVGISFSSDLFGFKAKKEENNSQ